MEQSKIIATIPIRTVPESNRGGEHWTAKSKRHKMQKNAVFYCIKPMISNHPIPLPITITICRIAPRKLDSHDNLAISLKWIADAIAELFIPGLKIGMADNDPRITFTYTQEKGQPKEYAVRIKIEKSIIN